MSGTPATTHGKWKENMLDRDTSGQKGVLEERYVTEKEAKGQTEYHRRDDVLVARPWVAEERVLEQ